MDALGLVWQNSRSPLFVNIKICVPSTNSNFLCVISTLASYLGGTQDGLARRGHNEGVLLEPIEEVARTGIVSRYIQHIQSVIGI